MTSQYDGEGEGSVDFSVEEPGEGLGPGEGQVENSGQLVSGQPTTIYIHF